MIRCISENNDIALKKIDGAEIFYDWWCLWSGKDSKRKLQHIFEDSLYSLLKIPITGGKKEKGNIIRKLKWMND